MQRCGGPRRWPRAHRCGGSSPHLKKKPRRNVAVLTGRPTELILYLGGRRSAAEVTLEGSDEAVAAVKRSGVKLSFVRDEEPASTRRESPDVGVAVLYVRSFHRRYSTRASRSRGEPARLLNGGIGGCRYDQGVGNLVSHLLPPIVGQDQTQGDKTTEEGVDQ